MTLQQFMIAYQENRRDIFILRFSNQKEIDRMSAAAYFTDAFDTAYGDCTISAFTVDVVDQYCLVFTIDLDEEDLNEIAE